MGTSEGLCVTYYPSVKGEKIDRDPQVVFDIVSHNLQKRTGKPGGLPIQCTSDIVATLGHHYLATIYDWPLYPT